MYYRKKGILRCPRGCTPGTPTRVEEAHMRRHGSCGVELIEQYSRSACQRDVSFGCVGDQAVWTRACRGLFRCSGRLPGANESRAFACGFPPGRERYACSCDSPSSTQDSSIYRPSDVWEGQPRGWPACPGQRGSSNRPDHCAAVTKALLWLHEQIYLMGVFSFPRVRGSSARRSWMR